MLVAAILLVAGGGAALAVVLSSGATSTTTTSKRRLPEGFVGAMVDGPVFAKGVNLDDQLAFIVATGVESLRVAVNWSAAQPYQSFSQVPPNQRSEFQDEGGVPTHFSELDRIVGPAAAHGLSVLPVVESAPRWDAQHPGSIASAPKSPAAYAAFLVALVRRYGPHGTFWGAHTSIRPVPIRMWQIWNEPNFVSYWSERPFAPSYVALLRASHAALLSADPGAKLVLAGLPDFSWKYLAQIYSVPGARQTFDIVAVHPYTAHAVGIPVILGKVRAVMDQFGDSAKPILATEISWPSSQGKAPQQFGIGTTEALQAQRLDQVLPLLAADRSKLGLIGFYWYTWMGDEGPRAFPYAFDYAGLLKYVGGQISAKPAFEVFRRGALAIESCRRKGTLASSCL
jgi:hypothetical protein